MDGLELARAVVEGVPGSVEAFWERYYSQVYRFVFWQVGGCHDDAEDVVQATMVGALRSLGRYRGDASLYCWLCGVAANKAADFRRREYRQGQLEAQLRELAVAQAPDVDAQELGEREERRMRLRQAMRRLRPRWRRVLALRYCLELSTGELAARVGQSYKTTESVLTRARAAFREVYDDGG